MHASESNSSNVPAFLIKLWNLVENPECDDCILWSDSGASFIIRDQAKFSKEILPLYFKHNNMASFIRQLNMYGFRKVMNCNKGGMKSDSDEMEFQHVFFVKDQANCLEFIKRKMPSGKGNESTSRSSSPKDVLSGLESIRKKQENMDALLLAMKKENEVLWKELSLLRKKHKTQEQIIQKVIHFLVTLVRSNQGMGPKRKIARMLHDSHSVKNKSSSISSQLNYVRNTTSPLQISTLTTEQLESPKGPFIHEVTDFESDDLEENEGNMTTASHSKDNCQLFLNEENNSPRLSETTDPLPSVSAVSPEILTSPDEIASSPVTGPLYLTNETYVVPEVLNLPSTSTDLNVETLLLSPETMIIGNDALNSEPLEVSFPSFEVPSDSDRVQIAADSCPDKTDTENIQSDAMGNYNSLLRCNTKDVFICDGNVEEKEKNCSQNNLQLALTETDPSNSDAFSKNMFSNHVVSIDDDLEWLQDQLTLGTLNIDASTLLNLFSTDGMINNPVLVNQFASENCDVKETDDIIGNELVQVTPSMLEVGADPSENPLFPDFVDSSSLLSVENCELNSQEIDSIRPSRKRENKDDDCIKVSYQSLLENEVSNSPVRAPSNRKRKSFRKGK